MDWIWIVMKRRARRKKKEKGIKKVSWKANDFGDEGVKMLSEGLKSNSSLTKLNLGSNEREHGVEKGKNGKWRKE